MNYVVGNVVADAVQGYNFWMQNGWKQNIPVAPGADPSQPGQYTTIQGDGMPLLQFSNNTAYGGTMRIGLWFWSLDTPTMPNLGNNEPISLIQNFHVWNVWGDAVYDYVGAYITFDNFVALDSFSELAQGTNGALGFYSGDYAADNVTITNSNIQGFFTGYSASATGRNQTIVNSYLRNYVDVGITPRYATGMVTALTSLLPFSVVINNDRFDPAGVPNVISLGQQAFIAMTADTIPLWANLIAPEPVTVYNFNGVAGDNFNVYFTQQAANYVLPQTQYDANGNITMLGAPVAGLTNAEAWAQYGIAFGGAVAPSTATTRANIIGLVNPF
jgi:hypothetical protein